MKQKVCPNCGKIVNSSKLKDLVVCPECNFIIHLKGISANNSFTPPANRLPVEVDENSIKELTPRLLKPAKIRNNKFKPNSHVRNNSKQMLQEGEIPTEIGLPVAQIPEQDVPTKIDIPVTGIGNSSKSKTPTPKNANSDTKSAPLKQSDFEKNNADSNDLDLFDTTAIKTLEIEIAELESQKTVTDESKKVQTKDENSHIKNYKPLTLNDAKKNANKQMTEAKQSQQDKPKINPQPKVVPTKSVNSNEPHKNKNFTPPKPRIAPKRKKPRDADILKELGVGEGQKSLREARMSKNYEKHYILRISTPDNKKLRMKFINALANLNFDSVNLEKLKSEFESKKPYVIIGNELTRQQATAIRKVLKNLNIIGVVKEKS